MDEIWVQLNLDVPHSSLASRPRPLGPVELTMESAMGNIERGGSFRRGRDAHTEEDRRRAEERVQAEAPALLQKPGPEPKPR